MEKDQEINEAILDSMKQTLKTKILSFSQKEFNLLIKYLSFGKEKIYKSNLFLKSNIDEFLKCLFTFVLKSKRMEDEQISLNLKKSFEILDNSIFNENKRKDNEEEEFEEEEEEEINEYRESKYKKLWNEVNEIIINKK